MARLALVATVAAALAAILVLFAVPDHTSVTRAVARTRAGAREISARQSIAAPAVVMIASRARTVKVPRSFFGLSTEYSGLPLFEQHMPLFERVLALVHAQGNGPLIVRIGGDSADRTFWDPRSRRLPPWVFGLTPAWLRRTRALVRHGGVRVILDMNLVTGSPAQAAQFASAAERELPRGSIVGFEIGNEPDIYSRPYWLAAISRRLGTSLLPRSLSTRSYTHDFRAYAHALAHIAPRVPLLGPVVANPALDVNWISGLLGPPHAGVGVVSAHRYPFSSCVARSSPNYPTVARLLTERASAGVAQTLSAGIRLAHRAGLPFRLTELNSVTCGGLAGVSDAFATALWAPDTLFELLRAGVDGVNVHVRAEAINGAFALTGGGLQARPLLYGLILFTRALGPDARLVPLHVDASRSLNLKVWAVRIRGGVLHVLVIDKGNRSARVDLRLPAAGPATVEDLLAPSAAARSGVTLDGQWLGRRGTWEGRPAGRTLEPGRYGYELTIPRVSAALLSVRLRPRAHALQRGHGQARHARHGRPFKA